MLRSCLAAGVSVLCVAVPSGGSSQELPFDGLLERLAASAPELRATAIEQYLNLFGRAPLIEGDTAIFLAEADGTKAPRVVGDFTDGGEYGEPVTDGVMTRIDGTDWYYLKLPLEPDARIQYQIAYGDVRRADPRNPRHVSSFGIEMSELRMPAYRLPPEALPDPTIPRGRVETRDFASRVLGNTRTMHVYLPAGYLATTWRYPVAYFGDGTTYLDQAKLPLVLDHAIVHTTVRTLIAVLVDPVNRREEYRGNPDYRRFVVEELVPFIDRTYRTIDAPEARVVVGSSRGALAAVDLAFHEPGLFGFAVALSPALRPTDITGAIEKSDLKPVRFYVVGSLYDAEWLPDARRLRDVLSAKGYDVVYKEIPEGHDVLAWRARIDDALATFLPGG